MSYLLSVPKYNYRKGDYEAMNDYLGNINWSDILSGNVHDNWCVFKMTIQNAIEKYIPASIPKNNKTTSWWSKNLSKAIKAKQLVFTKYKHSKSIPKNNKTTSWWSKNLSKAIKAKQLAFTKYKHSK